MPNLPALDPNVLYASLLWGAIGSGLLIYGKKQTRAPMIIGGLGLIAVTFFIFSAGLLSLVSIAILAAVYGATRLGY